MQRRVIPVLLLDRDRRLVKTVQFGERTYIGDPFNVIRLFNEKEVDELCILDIDATADHREPDLDFIRKLTSECFMPLSYGGGISKLEHCEALNRAGVEKFVVGSKTKDPSLLKSIADNFGTQSLIGCVDVRRDKQSFHASVSNGRVQVSTDVLGYCKSLILGGVGELMIQSIDNDGMRAGFDLELITSIAKNLSVPVIALGGAGNLEHLKAGLECGADAVASGSAFCFVGRLRAVLVTYPRPHELQNLVTQSHE